MFSQYLPAFLNWVNTIQRTDKNRPPTSRLFSNSLVTALFFFLVSGGLPAYTQNPENLEEKIIGEEDVKIVEIQPIAASDIAKLSEQTISNLVEIRGKIKPLEEVSKVAEDFTKLLEEINQLERQLKETNLNELKFNRLSVMQNSWEDAKSALTQWQDNLQTRSQDLEKLGQSLKENQELWEKTRNASKEREDPNALRDRISEVLDSIVYVHKALKFRQEAILTLMDKISQESIRINKALTKINQAIDVNREKIFAIDSPPLWKAFEKKEKVPPLLEQIRQTFEGRITLIKKFAAGNGSRMILHLGIFLFTALFLLNVRKQEDIWLKEDSSATKFKYIYHHPFSSALLLSLIFTSYIYKNTPDLVRELNRLLFLIPLLRIIPKIIYHEMRIPFYWLATLYVLQRLDDLIIDFSLVHRLILLLITLSTVFGLIYLLRPGSNFFKRKGSWRTAMILGGRISLVLMGISLLANVLGNISLADLLATATLNIAYVTVGVFAAILIMESIIVISMQSQILSKLRIVQKNSQLIQERVISLIRFAVVLLWSVYTLRTFKIFEPLKNFTLNFLSKSWKLGDLGFSLGDLLIFIFTIWLSIWISRLVRFILEEDVMPRIRLPRGVPASISTLTNYGILFIGFLIALTAAGVEWSKFALLAGAFGVGIGFGLQNVVNNFISGLILIFERPIKVADTVAVGQLNGVVKRIGIRSSTIRTFDGAEVIVPNGTLIQSEVTNWTLSDRLRRIEVKVGVAYGTDPNKVLEILKKVASENSVVLDNPAPMILFQGFGESSLDFSFRVWTSDYDNWLTFSSEITLEVHNALYKAGIEIPFPQRDLHLRSVDKNVPHLLKPPSGESGQQSKTGLKSKVESSKSEKQKAGEKRGKIKE
jgi:small-conductance mechanosensitive channel